MTATNIFNLDNFRKKKNHKTLSSHYDGTRKICERFELASSIVDELYADAKKLTKSAGMDFAGFKLIPDYEIGCLNTNLYDFFNGGDSTMSLAYDTYVNEIRYAVVVIAMIEGDEVEFDGLLVKWDSKTWLAYNYMNQCWEEGPGPDFV